MSAGGSATKVSRTLTDLAPKFAAAVAAGIEECNQAGYDAIVFEAMRSDALAAIYYTRGRPPSKEYPTPVTNAKDASQTWHGYGLAVDVISASAEWRASEDWFRAVADIMKRHGLDWGGDWHQKDLPHFQWGTIKPSPSPISQTLRAAGRIRDVWKLVGAADE